MRPARNGGRSTSWWRTRADPRPAGQVRLPGAGGAGGGLRVAEQDQPDFHFGPGQVRQAEVRSTLAPLVVERRLVGRQQRSDMVDPLAVQRILRRPAALPVGGCRRFTQRVPLSQELAVAVPEIPIALLSSKLADLISGGRRLRAAAIHPCKDIVTATLMQAAREAKLQVNIWTVNDPAEISKFRSLGADGIFTDFPERCLTSPS